MIEFTKMHGLGNDFIVVVPGQDDASALTALARRLCARHTGIGADGLLAVLPSQHHEVRMRIFNADGSEASMCGNGIRCLGRFVHDHGIVRATRFSVETRAGSMDLALRVAHDEVIGVSIGMGLARFEETEVPMVTTAEGQGRLSLEVAGREVALRAVNVGMPHAVVFVDDLDAIDVASLGAAIERSPQFPQGTNVNFVQRVGHGHLRVRTWERGVGATLACGSGSCASAVVACSEGLTGRHVRVELALGTLEVEWLDDGQVRMTGPAAYVCEGRVQ